MKLFFGVVLWIVLMPLWIPITAVLLSWTLASNTAEHIAKTMHALLEK